MKLDEITFHKTSFFPKIWVKKNSLNNAFVGIGGNEGKSLEIFKKLIFRLNLDKRVHVFQTSGVYKNPPFGYHNQAFFYNAIIWLQTKLSPQKLLKLLLHEEKVFKRKRSFKNAPRTLDLDLIFYDDKKFKSKHLILPHPFWQNRLSVILPLGSLKWKK